jgi:hypothetical protein
MTVVAGRMLTALIVLVAAVAAHDSARANHFILCDDAKCLNDATTTGDFDPSTVAQSYVIVALYSDQSGDTQYMRLRRNPGTDVPPRLAGSFFTVRHGGVAKRFVIPSDPAPGLAPGEELVFATTDDFSDDLAGSKPPDYILPPRFLPTDGGSIDLNGLNAWDFGPLPIDGSTALLRSGETARPCFSSHLSGTWCVAGGFSNAVEYVNDGLNRYFITASEPDIDAIESGRLAGWRRTGLGLPVLTTSEPECCKTPTPPVPVCRYYFPPPMGAAHFFSAFEDECAAVRQRFPEALLETRAAFFVVLPSDDGVCPGSWKPVFRIWDGLTAQHRYLDSQGRSALEALVRQGWVLEGRGADGVAWCE